MEVFDTTAQKTVCLEINDRKTGIEWTADLIGNAGDLHYNSERGMAEMTSEDIKWWRNTIAGLNKIEDLTEEAKELLSTEDFEDLTIKLQNNGDGNDYEIHISVLTTILNEVIKENKCE
jgi:hypothetical protein